MQIVSMEIIAPHCTYKYVIIAGMYKLIYYVAVNILYSVKIE